MTATSLALPQPQPKIATELGHGTADCLRRNVSRLEAEMSEVFWIALEVSHTH